jgi:serine/threonine protein kinase
MSDGKLKIADFGKISSILANKLNADGEHFGSPNFMSPEQRWKTHASNRYVSRRFALSTTAQAVKPFTGAIFPPSRRGTFVGFAITRLLVTIVPDIDPVLENLAETLFAKPEDRGGGARWLLFQLRTYLNQSQPPSHLKPTVNHLDKMVKWEIKL